MKKTIIVIENDLSGISREQFNEKIFHRVIPALEKMNPANMKLTITADHQPLLTVLPITRNGFAMLSLAEVDNEKACAAVNDSLDSSYTLSAYQVHESPFLLSERTWEPGEQSPGLVLLTMFQKREDLSNEEFMHIWFGEHSPKAIITHPIVNYIRNVVTGTLTDSTFLFNGIVEEHFINDSDLLNPVKMFGGIKKMIPSMIQVLNHVKTFIDLSTIRNYICREYLIVGELAATNRETRDDIVKADLGGILTPS